jgi:uncharacterized membrane protein
MEGVWKHVYKNLIAGVVALLPIGGTILGIAWLDFTISESWLAQQPFYFPGMGLVAVLVVIYLVGLAVSTFLGRFAWSLADGILKRLPLLGSLYATLKQILGYGEGGDAIFEKAVFVRSRENDAEELGLITNRLQDDQGADKVIVFVPGSPNPSTGRLLVLDESEIRPLGMKVNDALTALVSVGKSGLDLQAETEHSN